MARTLYLWDLSGTLFSDNWNKKKSGFESYDDYVKSLGYDNKTITPKEWEWAYEKPYRDGLMEVDVARGFQEVLSWTTNNAVFTTGNREQIDWRAEQILRKGGFDARDYLKEIYSTFDYGDTNVKTTEMLIDILRRKYQEGYNTIVYTDDKPENCDFFKKAAREFQKEKQNFQFRVYHMQDGKGNEKNEDYLEIGNLFGLLKNEKSSRE